jgi:hypothetical protein
MAKYGIRLLWGWLPPELAWAAADMAPLWAEE